MSRPRFWLICCLEIVRDNALCGGLHLIRLAFALHRLACGLGHDTALTAVSRLSFTTVSPLRYPQGEGFRTEQKAEAFIRTVCKR